MPWFIRSKKNITTPTESKKDVKKGLWYKTPSGKIIETEELKANAYVSPEDDHHVQIGSQEYYEILFDEGKFTDLDANVESNASDNVSTNAADLTPIVLNATMRGANVCANR